MKKIIKRDGSVERFNMAKIARVVHAAGLNESQSKKLAKAVSVWIDSQPEEVSSLVVRDRVQEELKKVNTNASNLFAWYEKTKE
jgi:transcriptional regulator NrdR family protein